LNQPKPSLLIFRWMAIATATGALIALIVDVLNGTDTFRVTSLALAAATAAIVGYLAYASRNYERHMREAAEIAERNDAERSELQLELQRRNELEHQLRQAKQDAESAVMAKGEFLATMSHEIRTPLNGIIPMLDLLMSNRLAVDQAEMVHTAYLSAQQMLRIVDDILDYSKLEASKLQLESTTFNLRETLESVIQLMERPAQGKGLRLSLQIDPSVRLPVRGDSVRLRQILTNLISNAVKFTERGSVTLNVRKIGETSAQHQLRFEVRDTGIGIPLVAQERLFQAFSQADASTTRLYGGTGLGLAISKRIVDLMGGRIGVESEAGQGALFWFEVPMLKVQGDITAHKPAENTGGRVLLLTGDQRLRLRLSMLLPNWGLRITTVETTQEALERLRSAANQGAGWAYTAVIADLASVRSTAVALQRNLERQNTYGQVQLIGLLGDEPAPEELLMSATLLQRHSPDADLRAALLGTIDTTPQPMVGEFALEDAPAAAAAPAMDAMPGAAAPAAVDAASAPSTEPEPAKPMRVLLVEDNPVNLMVGQRLLSVLGTHCDSATNGEAALLRMSASRYDLVLMDCQMPVMDGYTATRRWREHEAATGSRRLPIVAMTANAMAGDRQKCLDAGMDDYLAKPVTRGELERCLFHWHQISAQHPPAEAAPADTPAPAAAAAPAPAPEPAPAPAPMAIPPAPASASAPAPAPAPAPVAAPVPAPTLVPPPTAAPAPAPVIAPVPVPPPQAMPAAAAASRAPSSITAPVRRPATAAAGTPPTPPAAPAIPQISPSAPAPVAPPPAPASSPDATLQAAANRSHISANPFVNTTPPSAKPAPAPAAAPAEPPAPVLDMSVIDELRSILGGEVERLVEVFLDDTPTIIAALEIAAAGPDMDGLRNAAHTLKSSSANLGAMSLSNAAKRVELAARMGTLERPAVAVAMIANEFARARQALRANMSQASTG
jgi:signal transduction histidine kinase/CheY-like chemotaxis protein